MKMNQKNNKIEYLLLIIGIVLALAGGYKLITDEKQTDFQDEVVEIGEGFSPVLVPINAQEVQDTANSGFKITFQAPDFEGTGLPESVEITPNPMIPTPQPTQEEATEGPAIPDHIIIPVIELDAPVIEAGTRKVRVNGQIYEQYTAPDEYAAGWHPDSALLGVVGNTVLNGHHNVHGEVFSKLVDLEAGDIIYIFSGDRQFGYMVTNKMILPELGEDVSIQQRLENARWIMESLDERLTLVTCWPAYSNTHRLVIVAKPIQINLVPAQ